MFIIETPYEILHDVDFTDCKSALTESRREWMLNVFEKFCEHLKRNQTYKVWQNGNHAEVIYSNRFFDQKLNYIHQNPVEEMIVTNAEDYLFNSARNYAELPFLLEIIMETQEMVTYN